MWKRALSPREWDAAHAIFHPTSEESGGHWIFKKQIPERWEMAYDLEGVPLRFWAMTTPGRHLGVFPETASHWDFIAHALRGAQRPLRVLNLFGYTGLASLTAAAHGAQVTHVDASRKAVTWARANQVLSGLQEKPIRWIVEDALKFALRESRRGVRYDGIVLDPPKFGRGPRGEVWEVYKSLPHLLETCCALLSERPLFVIVTLYAVRASAVHLSQALQDRLAGYAGRVVCGELATRERSAGRWLSHAVYARWCARE